MSSPAPATGSTVRFPALSQTPRPPRRHPVVPGYEIVREVGTGGMGVVYLARQPRLDRPVALKMLKTGVLAGDEAHARFADEARIVARLRHPNIVQLYEFGAVLDVPYVALEYVDGPTLAQHLAGTPQPAAWAAGLVERIARAMQYAHEQGVIHRDLKPSNILLQVDSGQWTVDRKSPGADSSPSTTHCPLSTPSPKVTDFGLARLLNDDTIRTQTGFASGTPGYMAPEQVRGDHDQIGPWTDVYALGVVLYECLTGRTPFGELDAAAALVATTTRDPAAPRSVRPDVPRDLEKVCLKCLAREPRDRYLTAAALAADLRRYLDGRPVEARRAGVAERGWKFVRRNPLLCGLWAALVASLAVGFAAASVLYVRAEDRRSQADLRRAQAEEAQGRAEKAEAESRANAEQAKQAAATAVAAEEQARRATAEAHKAREAAEADRDRFKAINMFVLNDLVYAARPAEGPGRSARDATLREVILAAAPLIEVRFKNHPETMAAMDQTVGVTLRHLGEYAAAERHLERAVAAHRTHSPADDVRRFQSLNSLGVVYLARSKWPEAEATLREAIAGIEAMPAPTKDHTDLLLTSRQNLGNLLLQTGKAAEAVGLLKQAFADLERNDGADSMHTISAAINLARAYHATGKKELAVKTAWDAVARAECGTGPNTPSVAGALGVVVDLRMGEPAAEADAGVAGRSARVHAAAFGPDHPLTVNARRHHATILLRLKHYGEASRVLTELLEPATRRHGAGSDVVRYAESELAVALAHQWRFAEAVRRAEAARDRLGRDHPSAAPFDQLIRDIRADWAKKQHAAPAALGATAAAPLLVGSKL